jgi:hypothetical protein
MFGDTDPRIFKESYSTLHVCKYLGGNGTQVIDAKWIMDVVAMVPFKNIQKERGYTEGKQYFAVEKMSVALIGRSDSGGDTDDIDIDNLEEDLPVTE